MGTYTEYHPVEMSALVFADASELLSALVDDNPTFLKLYKMYNLMLYDEYKFINEIL